MKKLIKVGLTGVFLGLFAFLPVSSATQLIHSADAISNPLTCKNPGFKEGLEALNFCNPAVQVVESAQPKPLKKPVKKKEVPRPVHQSAAVFYTPPAEQAPTLPETTPTVPQPTPTPLVTLDPNVIFDLMNAHRIAIGLTPFEKDPKLCEIAESRRGEIPGEIVSGYFHSGLFAKNLPFWITENMKYGSNEAGTVNWWLNSPIHRAAIEGNYKYSCGITLGDSAIALFTNWDPR